MHMKLRSCCADNFRQGISESAGAAMALQFTLSPPSSPAPAPLLPLLLTFMAVVIAAEAASPYPFLTEDAASAVDGKEYDYIVVGAGTAGCALAATLSEQYKVLLLERGGSLYDVPSTQSSDRLFETLAAADASANGTSAAQAFVSEDGVDNVRGRVLGGSSALNFGFYSRASGAYITSMGWNQTLVTESYRWVETQLVSTYQKLKTWQRALYRAMIDADLGPDNGFTLDHVAGAKRSGSTFDAAGRRRSAAELLRRADPANIVVLLRATAARVVLRSGSAGAPPEVLGVELADKAGRRRVARIRGNDLACRARGSCSEVVLCAGALGSPQLLMLSGVGPAEHLRQLGIDVVVDLPAVGADVADPPRNNVTVVSKVALEFSMPQVVAIAGDESWYVESFSMQAPDGTSLAYVAEKVATPASRGRLRLRSRDPGENPAVRFNYFEDGVDVAACARAMRSIGDVLRTGGMETFVDRAAMGKVAENSLLPSDLSDEGGVQDFCRRTVRTMWHFHGGCGVGSVVNQQYQVIGGILNDNLRIVDASTHSASPGTNPQATTLMLGRYVGVQILRERERMGGAMSRRKHR